VPINSGILTLTGYTGTIIKWQNSIDNGNTWVDIAGTSGATTYTYSNITHNTIYRVLVQSGNCLPDSVSAIAKVYTGVVTTAGSSVVCSSNDVYVPITVTSFMDITSISLTLLYDTTKLTYVDASENPTLTTWGLQPVNIPTKGTVKIAGYDLTTLTLPDNTALLTLHFTQIPSFTSTNLIWSDPPSHPEYCEYAIPMPLPRYPWDTIERVCDIPTATYYKNDTITITTLPVVNSIAYLGSPYCSNAGTATVTLSGNLGGTYTALPSTGLSLNSSTGAVNLGSSTAGTYSVTYTIAAAGGCPAVSASTTITITRLPVVTSIAYLGTPYCSNAGTATVTLTGDPGGAYTALPATGLSLNSSTGAVTLGSSTAGTYTVTYTIAASGGCLAVSASTTITITTLPVVNSIAYLGTPYCSNAGTATVTLSGNSGGSYTSDGGLMINASTGAVTLSTSTAGTHTVTYTIAAAGGCSAVSKSTTITITTLPIVNSIAYLGTPYCSNAGTATVTLSGNAGGSYTSDGGLVINASTGAVTLSTSTAGTHTVTYTIAAAGGCSAVSASTTITITTLPVVNSIAYLGTPYCSNAGTATVTLSGNAGGTYTSDVGLVLNASTGSVTLSTSTAGTHTVTYTIAAAGGCSAISKSTTITITTLPIVNSITYLGTPYCSNAGTATVTLSGNAGGSYTSDGGLVINASTGAVTLSTSTAGTHTVTYTIAAAGGCSAVSASTTITITTLPVVNSIVYLGTPYCSNAGIATVTLSGNSGGTYTSDGGLVLNASTGAVTLGTSTAGIHTVTYTIAAAGGCSAVSNSTTITITTLPVVHSIAYLGTPYCSNAGTATVTLSGNSGGSYTSDGGLVINASTGAVTLSTSTAGTHTVTYTIAAAGGCSAVSASTTITITTLPVINSMVYLGTPYCSNAGTATVTLSGSSGGIYTSDANLVINASTGAVTLGTSTAGTHTVTYTIAAAGGCSVVSSSTTITITRLPVVTSISYSGTPYCGTQGTAMVTRSGDPGGTYTAVPSGLNLVSASGNIDLGSSTPGTYTVTYTIAAAGGCSAVSASTSITIKQPYTFHGVMDYWNNNTPLGNVNINLWDSTGALVNYTTTAVTDTIGKYSFNVCHGTYRLTFYTDKNNGGINATDAAQVNSWFVMPYAIEKVRAYAGDVVTDDWLDAGDASRILGYFLTNGNPTWAIRGLWTFWLVNDLVSNNPLPTPENVLISVPGTTLVHNLYGLCTGDFNGSFIPDQTMKSASNTLSLNYGGTMQVKTGEEFDLPLYTQSAIDVGAISMIMNFPSDKLEIIGVKLAGDDNTSVLFNVSGDELRIGWFSRENLSLKAGDKMVTLRVKLIGSLEQNEILRFTLASDPLNELSDALGIVIPDAILNMDMIGTTLGINPGSGTESIRFTNYPNPFNGSTTLAYSLPTTGNVTIELNSMLGVFDRVILNNMPQTSGDYKLVLDASDLPDGVYIATLKLTSDEKTITCKIKIVKTN
jgi:hypothetical protein